jgi:hypothetical protein
MQSTDILTQMGGIQSIAQALGVSENTTMQGAAALLPVILGGMHKQVQAQAGGFGSLGGLLGQLTGGNNSGGLLGQVFGQIAGRTDNATSGGNDILGQIFGSKDISRTVADDAASRSGLDVGLLKQMLPLLAMMVTNYLSQQSAGAQPSEGLSDLLSSSKSQQSGGLSGLAAMLDSNGDGNVLDDILRIAGKSLR